jgi:hypothetical protein
MKVQKSNVKKWCRTVRKMINYRLENDILYSNDIILEVRNIQCGLVDDDIILVVQLDLHNTLYYVDKYFNLEREYSFIKLPQLFLNKQEELLKFVSQLSEHIIEKCVIAAPSAKDENDKIERQRKELQKKLEKMDIQQLHLYMNEQIDFLKDNIKKIKE